MPSRKKDRNVIQPSDSEGEAFDFNISASSSVADTDIGSNHSRPRAAPAVAAREPTIAPTAPVVPIVATPIGAVADKPPTIPTTGSNRANDVHYFYTKCNIDVKGVLTLRNVCTLCL
jgi:hypothetical protein